MALVTAYGSRIMTGLVSTPAVLADPGEGGGKLRYWCETVESATDDSSASTYLMARLPSNARISGISNFTKDAQGAVTATVLSIGVYNSNPNVQAITDSTTALNSNIQTSVATSVALIADRANYGKRLWELAGASADPKTDLDIKLRLFGNLASGAGTMTVEIFYSTD